MSRSRKGRVLVVDDDARSGQATADWLLEAGWSAVVTDRCSEAMKAAGAAGPDHLLVEQKLCDGSGFDLFLRLRARNAALSGLVVTRHGSIAGAVHAMRLGFRDYLVKPLDCRRLAEYFGESAVDDDGAPPFLDAADERPSLGRVEWEHIHSVLLQCEGNVSEAARRLGLHRRSLQRRLRRGLNPLEARQN